MPTEIGAQSAAVTRRDLADAYLELDRVAMTAGIPEAQRAAWNRDFDRTTLAFFSGDFPKVLRDMHDLLARMAGDAAPGSATRQLLGLRVRPATRVLVAGRDVQLNIVATVLYADSAITQARTLALRIRDAAGRTQMQGSIVVPAGSVAGQDFRLYLDAAQIVNAPGRYTVEATLPGAALPRLSELFVLAEPAAAIRARLLADIAALPPTADPQSVAAVRARTQLIVEQPDESRSAQFIADPAALAVDVEREVQALQRGARPFELRTGDYWRVIVGPRGEIPVRLFAPRAAQTGARLPVVIALHGAGADENMFFEGYGDGRLRALADSAEFLLLTPETNAFARDAGALDSALALLEREYVIDRSAVYLLGRSLGGAAAIALAGARPDQVRAVAALTAFGAAPAAGTMPPTLFLAASEDLVIPETRVRAAYATFRARGLVSEITVAEGWGHTLVVGARLDEVLRWLFER